MSIIIWIQERPDNWRASLGGKHYAQITYLGDWYRLYSWTVVRNYSEDVSSDKEGHEDTLEEAKAAAEACWKKWQEEIDARITARAMEELRNVKQ